jgi:hypothetical protein
MNKIIKFFASLTNLTINKNESKTKEKDSNKKAKPFYAHRNRWGFPTIRRKDK